MSPKYLGDRGVKEHNFFSETFLEQPRLNRSPERAEELSSSPDGSLLKYWNSIQGKDK